MNIWAQAGTGLRKSGQITQRLARDPRKAAFWMNTNEAEHEQLVFKTREECPTQQVCDSSQAVRSLDVEPERDASTTVTLTPDSSVGVRTP